MNQDQLVLNTNGYQRCGHCRIKSPQCVGSTRIICACLWNVHNMWQSRAYGAW